jgi:hypothetical protein
MMPDDEATRAWNEVMRGKPVATERPHHIEAIPNSGGGITHYCHVCGQMGVGLAPALPCPGPPKEQDQSA